jgi:hypothetical protein
LETIKSTIKTAIVAGAFSWLPLQAENFVFKKGEFKRQADGEDNNFYIRGYD